MQDGDVSSLGLELSLFPLRFSILLAPSHCLVTFDDGSNSNVPVSHIKSSQPLKSDDRVQVQWTDGQLYDAVITALGMFAVVSSCFSQIVVIHR